MRCGGSCPVIRSIVSHNLGGSQTTAGEPAFDILVCFLTQRTNGHGLTLSRKNRWRLVNGSSSFFPGSLEHAGSIQSILSIHQGATCFDCHAFAEQTGTILQSTELRANGVGLGSLAFVFSISISNAENGFVRKPTPTSLASPAGHDQFVKLEHAQIEFQMVSFCIQVGSLWGWRSLGWSLCMMHRNGETMDFGGDTQLQVLAAR